MMVKRYIKSFILVLALFFVMVPITFAADGDGGDVIIIEAGETITDDYYVGAESFVLDGTIQGDLFVGGTSIVINGTVEGDLFAGGQSIIINGTVKDDVRAGATAVEVTNGASIGGDLIVGGFSLQTASESSVDGDVVFGGFQALLNGGIEGDILAAANGLEINGRVGGRVRAEVGGSEDAPPIDPLRFAPDAPNVPSVKLGLTVGERAQIVGDLTYSGPEEASISSNAVEGDTEFSLQTPSPGEEESGPSPIWRVVRRLIALLVIGLLFVWRMPSWIQKLSNMVQENPLPSLGYGAAVYFGGPIVLFIVVGITIAMAALLGAIGLGNLGASLFWIVAAITFVLFVALVMVILYLTKLIVSYWVGHMILSRINSDLAENPMWSLILGIVIVVILISIPFLGDLLNLLVAIIGVGALFLIWRGRDEIQEKSLEAV